MYIFADGIKNEYTCENFCYDTEREDESEGESFDESEKRRLIEEMLRSDSDSDSDPNREFYRYPDSDDDSGGEIYPDSDPDSDE